MATGHALTKALADELLVIMYAYMQFGACKQRVD